MTIGVIKDKLPERRVALSPESVQALSKLKVNVIIEKDSGIESNFSNDDYKTAGGEILPKDDVIKKADLLVKVGSFDDDEIKLLKARQVVLSVMNPLSETDVIAKFNAKPVTAFSMDLVPRSTRAQSMDVLSSQATVAGYKAVLHAATLLPKFFPMFMSAAGTVKPAKILILGAGVAGLQAIAIARKLGAVVEVFDVRSAVKEEVQSLGGKFIEVEGALEDKAAGGYAVEQTEEFKNKQSELIQQHAQKANVVICTAQIPGRKAPVLIHKSTVENMAAGSVIIDLAASTGGNCELTKNNEIINHNGVTIVGESNYPSTVPYDASNMLSKNYVNFLKLIISETGELNLNFDDDIVAATCLVHNGELVNERVKNFLNK